MVFYLWLEENAGMYLPLCGIFVCIPAWALVSHCELNNFIPLILLDFIWAKFKIKISLTNKNVGIFEFSGAFEHWLNFKINAG